ncbi:hypothetical protein [Kiloniella sp. b19]|uniref:hypothetical protein n=1 Tax=Kiloniella sp. GXU_MW_B19 TaxID=3141326 RepID=UPI0031E09DA8
MSNKTTSSPYLQKPLRSLEEVQNSRALDHGKTPGLETDNLIKIRDTKKTAGLP